MLGSFGLGSVLDSCFAISAPELFAELFDAILVRLDTALN
jgi:hypothetical protein